MTIVVIGAGITGLAAAHALGRLGIPVLVLEASEHPGGKVRTERVDGFVIDHGPDSFVTYKPAMVALARELGLGGEIIQPNEPRTVFIRTRGRLRRLPDGMGLALPTRIWPFVTTDLFTPLEKARMGLDLILPRDRRTGDLGVGPFLERRLGRALVDRLAGPLIGGVYGTPVDDLSLDAVVPALRASEREHRSLLLASLADGRARARTAEAARAGDSGAGSAPPSPFVALSGGIGQLTDELASVVRGRSGSELRTDARVVALEAEGAHAVVRLQGGEAVAAEGVILATDGPAAIPLLGGVSPRAARAVEAVPMSTVTIVTLAYAESDVPESVRGHGFLVANDERLSLSACTLTSRKWPGRAPAGMLLARTFFRPTAAAAAEGATATDGEALMDLAHRELGGIYGLRAAPVLRRVSRYSRVMPQYTVGHLQRLAAVDAGLAGVPWLRVAGAAYRGAGLPDCIAQGQAAATSLAALVEGAVGVR